MANDNGNGTSLASAKKYISSGVSLMSGGDTLIIADGEYTGTSNRISNPPSGSAGNYTTIKAETDFGVILRNVQPVSGYGAVVYMKSRSYVTIKGFRVLDITPYTSTSPGSPFLIESSNHIRLIRCGSDGTVVHSSGIGNVGGAFSFYKTSYSLMEECYAFGHGRYPFGVGDGSTGSLQLANYNIFRRCVQRWDYSNNLEVQASFAIYAEQHCAIQNCIAIDGLDIRGMEGSYDGIKAFFTPNGAIDDIRFDGNIVLNYEGAGYWIEDGPIINVTLNDNIAWDVKDGDNGSTDGYPAYLYTHRYDIDGGPLTINHATFGNSDYGYGVRFDQFGSLPDDSIKNSIIMNVTLDDGIYALEGTPTTEDYNYYYNNTGGRNKSGGVGAHSVTNVNPSISGLLYLPRIEFGSALKTGGESGGKVGAEIMYKIGRDSDGDGICGLLWGETGWDELQDGSGDSDVRPLWPFPNEDIIKTDMASFSMEAGEAYNGSPAMNGARGFCANGKQKNGIDDITLTSYIWEYLGNQIPTDIYVNETSTGSGETLVVPGSPQSLTVGQ